jgi:putative hemolysin
MEAYMDRKILLISTILVCMMFSASCKSGQPTPTPEANIPNPASAFCEQQGYRVEIRTAEDGSQTGYCIFPDGSECDEWAFYRGECAPLKLTADQLVIENFELVDRPDPETLQFSSVDGQEFSAADFEISTPFPFTQMEGAPLRFSVTLNGETLIASQDIQPCEFAGCINVRRGDQEIFRTDAGGISPIEPLQGLWTYDDHWVLETNLFLDDKPFNGQVFVDGQSLNQQNGYQESFGFQTINDRPFYFFRRDGKVDAWFDGQEISLGYDDVPHYLCCGDSGLNPKARQGAVLFFGNKDDKWYFVRITQPNGMPATTDAPQANMSYPASAYCEQQGYQVEIRTAADGSQAGVPLMVGTDLMVP